ncbi:MAG: PadR family transcriptional regulator [Demequinaceae bacterium]|nr:PadR family transcriptional regulator [Demequinaceae bacterium]
MRAAILVLLAEQPRHGYDLIRAIEERSGGLWTPSAGSIYPTLQALEDEGLLTIATVEGRRTASLTSEGLAWVDEHGEHHQGLFDTEGAGDAAGSLRAELLDLRHAAMHVARRQDRSDLAASALEILVKARKDMYRLLADDES